MSSSATGSNDGRPWQMVGGLKTRVFLKASAQHQICWRSMRPTVALLVVCDSAESLQVPALEHWDPGEIDVEDPWRLSDVYMLLGNIDFRSPPRLPASFSTASNVDESVAIDVCPWSRGSKTSLVGHVHSRPRRHRGALALITPNDSQTR